MMAAKNAIVSWLLNFRIRMFVKSAVKAETLLNDESQRIPTTNLLVKNQHGVQRQIQENFTGI